LYFIRHGYVLRSFLIFSCIGMLVNTISYHTKKALAIK
jgi:hypothetical protein